MPSLRQLDCQIEWANTGTAFEEYGTVYGDGVVETYIVIPSSPQNFSVRVKSQGYIFDGLAVLVFMDGEYQCNRNRLNLKPPETGLPRSATEIDFRLRQKEKPVGDGSFIGREWRFDTHNLVPVVPEDADSGHFDNLGTIEILVLRCTNKSDDDTRSTSSSALDTDPLGKHPETEASASVFEDASQGQEAPSGYTAPAVAEEDDDGVGFGGGMFDLFDGVNDRPHRPIFGGDGPSDGYWAYYPYQQGHNVYNEGQQWGTQPRYNPGHLPTGAFPQARPPQPAAPEKRVHFDIGGPPNTRAAPPPAPQQWPDVSVPAPALGPANHGVGQQGAYPIHPYSIPFEAIPPFPGPQMTPGNGIGATWGGQGYMPCPIHPGYGHGYGTAPGYGCYSQGYHQGQGYGRGQGEPMHGPTVNQNGNMNRSNGSGDSAKHENLQDSSWGDSNNAGNTSGNAGGDGGWSDNNNGYKNTSGGDGWDNNNASNDATNADGNNDTWGQDDEKNDTGEDTHNNESGSQIGWGETINVTTPQQNDTSWENNDSGITNQDWGNNDSSNQNDQNWGNTNSSNQNQKQGNDSWGLNKDNNTTNQPFRPVSQPDHPSAQVTSQKPAHTRILPLKPNPLTSPLRSARPLLPPATPQLDSDPPLRGRRTPLRRPPIPHQRHRLHAPNPTGPRLPVHAPPRHAALPRQRGGPLRALRLQIPQRGTARGRARRARRRRAQRRRGGAGARGQAEGGDHRDVAAREGGAGREDSGAGGEGQGGGG